MSTEQNNLIVRLVDIFAPADFSQSEFRSECHRTTRIQSQRMKFIVDSEDSDVERCYEEIKKTFQIRAYPQGAVELTQYQDSITSVRKEVDARGDKFAFKYVNNALLLLSMLSRSIASPFISTDGIRVHGRDLAEEEVKPSVFEQFDEHIVDEGSQATEEDAIYTDLESEEEEDLEQSFTYVQPMVHASPLDPTPVSRAPYTASEHNIDSLPSLSFVLAGSNFSEIFFLFTSTYTSKESWDEIALPQHETSMLWSYVSNKYSYTFISPKYDYLQYITHLLRIQRCVFFISTHNTSRCTYRLGELLSTGVEQFLQLFAVKNNTSDAWSGLLSLSYQAQQVLASDMSISSILRVLGDCSTAYPELISIFISFASDAVSTSVYDGVTQSTSQLVKTSRALDLFLSILQQFSKQRQLLHITSVLERIPTSTETACQVVCDSSQSTNISCIEVQDRLTTIPFAHICNVLDSELESLLLSSFYEQQQEQYAHIYTDNNVLRFYLCLSIPILQLVRTPALPILQVTELLRETVLRVSLYPEFHPGVLENLLISTTEDKNFVTITNNSGRLTQDTMSSLSECLQHISMKVITQSNGVDVSLHPPDMLHSVLSPSSMSVFSQAFLFMHKQHRAKDALSSVPLSLQRSLEAMYASKSSMLRFYFASKSSLLHIIQSLDTFCVAGVEKVWSKCLSVLTVGSGMEKYSSFMLAIFSCVVCHESQEQCIYMMRTYAEQGDQQGAAVYSECMKVVCLPQSLEINLDQKLKYNQNMPLLLELVSQCIHKVLSHPEDTVGIHSPSFACTHETQQQSLYVIQQLTFQFKLQKNVYVLIDEVCRQCVELQAIKTLFTFAYMYMAAAHKSDTLPILPIQLKYIPEHLHNGRAQYEALEECIKEMYEKVKVVSVQLFEAVLLLDETVDMTELAYVPSMDKGCSCNIDMQAQTDQSILLQLLDIERLAFYKEL